MSPISQARGGTSIRVYIQSRASRTEIAGLHGDAIRIRLAAPPVGGAANGALVRLLASVLGVAQSAITIRSGLSGRHKVVFVAGRSPVEVAARFPLPGSP